MESVLSGVSMHVWSTNHTWEVERGAVVISKMEGWSRGTLDISSIACSLSAPKRPEMTMEPSFLEPGVCLWSTGSWTCPSWGRTWFVVFVINVISRCQGIPGFSMSPALLSEAANRPAGTVDLPQPLVIQKLGKLKWHLGEWTVPTQGLLGISWAC